MLSFRDFRVRDNKNILFFFKYLISETLVFESSQYVEIIFKPLRSLANILDKKFFSWLYINGHVILKNQNKNAILKAIHKSCTLKSSVVKKDEFENNYRAVLNFGHTFAHAIETATNYSKKIIHGEAVLIGMMVASRLSNHLGYLKNNDPAGSDI